MTIKEKVSKNNLRRIKVNAWICKCARCGCTWTAIKPEPPRACSGCKAINWWRPSPRRKTTKKRTR